MTGTEVGYLQPHEGIHGEDRSGDPVLESQEVSDLVAGLAWHLRRVILVPHSSIQTQLNERLNEPHPGNLVVVRDAIRHPDPDARFRGVGYLIDRRVEWWMRDEQWETYKADGTVYPDDPRPVLHASYVQYGPAPGDVRRWVNCDVLALPRFGERWI